MDDKHIVALGRFVTAFIRCCGMVAENQVRSHRQEHPAYTSEDFEKVIVEEGTHWNAIAELLYH